ncbi:RNA 2',3'-cyclic phosphodiesterase [Candidatus Parcubacteria bacterium]|nr:MAG: RNA 2',3'-cyclic phosphodiesterase [Candidatus Parcubacteria bacterium]
MRNINRRHSRRFQHSRKQRIFIAIPVGAAIRTRLARIAVSVREVLQEHKIEFKWVDPSLWHLTLLFLGSHPERTVPRVAAAISRAASCVVPFPVRYLDIRYMPRAHPRMVWVRTDAVTSERLFSLRELVRRELPREVAADLDTRPVQGHITLCRFREYLPLSLLPPIPAASLSMSEEAREVLLMQSQLSPAGPSYTTLARHSLMGIASHCQQEDAGVQ